MAKKNFDQHTYFTQRSKLLNSSMDKFIGNKFAGVLKTLYYVIFFYLFRKVNFASCCRSREIKVH